MRVFFEEHTIYGCRFSPSLLEDFILLSPAPPRVFHLVAASYADDYPGNLFALTIARNRSFNYHWLSSLWFFRERDRRVSPPLNGKPTPLYGFRFVSRMLLIYAAYIYPLTPSSKMATGRVLILLDT